MCAKSVLKRLIVADDICRMCTLVYYNIVCVAPATAAIVVVVVVIVVLRKDAVIIE